MRAKSATVMGREEGETDTEREVEKERQTDIDRQTDGDSVRERRMETQTKKRQTERGWADVATAKARGIKQIS